MPKNIKIRSHMSEL